MSIMDRLFGPPKTINTYVPRQAPAIGVGTAGMAFQRPSSLPMNSINGRGEPLIRGMPDWRQPGGQIWQNQNLQPDSIRGNGAYIYQPLPNQPLYNYQGPNQRGGN